WHNRLKDEFFKEYNQLAAAFCKIIDLDPWHLGVDTTLFDHFDINDDESRAKLAADVDKVIARLKSQYQSHGQNFDPFVFIKNNAGTYGLGVTQADSGSQILSWNNKTRKKMKAAKGGREIEQVIIQEGIPTTVTSSGATAEPALY